MVIQPSEFISKNDLGWNVGNAIKYLCRHEMKGGKLDLEKAIHYIELEKEQKYEEEKYPSNNYRPCRTPVYREVYGDEYPKDTKKYYDETPKEGNTVRGNRLS
jgi:hypothetical protein